MTFIKKYWTLIAIAAAFAIGVLIAPRSDKDLERQFEKERKQLKADNKRLKGQIIDRDEVIKDVREKLKSDSLENSKRLIASNKEINRLRKKINDISFKNANSATLDSAIIALYGSESLLTH